MLIYEALKKDHEKVKMLLSQLIALEDGSKDAADLVEQIRDELIPHSRAEEAVFYNPLREANEPSGIAMHGYQEHAMAEALLRTLQAQSKVNLGWKTTAKELKTALEHHIQEEEGEMFALAQQVFTEEEAIQFGAAFEKMKPEIKEEGLMGTTLELIKNLMPPKFSNALKAKNPSQKHI